MTVDLTRSLTAVNSELEQSGTGAVRYTMQANKSFQYDGDVLSGMSTDITFNLMADTTDVDTLKMPWAIAHLPWLQNSNFRLVSCDIDPNGGNRMTTYTRWREVYRRVSGEAAGVLPQFFDVVETISMPVWITKFFYYNNPRLGLGNDEAVTKRLRQTFGLTPVQGEIQAKTLQPINFNADPYSFINKSFGSFDGVIKNATVSESMENGQRVYTLSLSWSGGKVGAGELPTYTI